MLPQQTSDQRVEQTAAAGQLLKQGVTAFRGGDKALARNLIAQAADLAPQNELVWMWTASTARNRAEALEALDRVLELNPDNAKALEWLKRLRPSNPRPAANGNAATIAAKQEAKTGPAVVAVPPKASPTPAAERDPDAETVESDVEEKESNQQDKSLALAAAVGAATSETAPQTEQETVATDSKAEDETQQESTPTVAALTPAQQRPSPIEDDPIRALLQRKADGIEERPEEEAESGEAPYEVEARQAPDTKDDGEAPEGVALEAAPVEGASEAEADSEAEGDGIAAEPQNRPISDQTCLLCGNQSLTSGACGYCRAIADISMLDEISRNENVDRTAMLAAVDRFRKELEAGPNFEANLGLALAYLNMKQSNDALPRLGEACRLQPDNIELKSHYDRLRSRRLILVVDDSKTVQKMISGVLERELYRVTLAEDGLQALARLDDETPSLILLDITMPRMDGYQVARIITGNDATASIPVVMLSGNDGFFDRIRGKLAGAKGYITKPFDPAELTETIQRYLDN